ncbi:MAG: molybdate ABC transporter permease subunit [Proteobacteria bacterium]|nr:molybdate ABC transporter permease subunit [Pseudomonadota bacterium]
MELFPGFSSLILSLKLAGLTTVLLLVLGIPLAWWLSRTRIKFKPVIEALVALPIVLPPTVLGFYFLLFLGPNGWLGQMWVELTGHALTFSFTGLVIASMIYSLPFVVQPIQSSFESVDNAYLEVARTLGASKLDAFIHVALPLSKRGILTACVLGFAHTLGEFGVILMVGGSIPNETKVVSIEIYEQVESLNFDAAHQLSAILLIIAFVIIFLMYFINQKSKKHHE